MNHRPFEDWLLEDKPLTPEEKRELQSHLRSCTSCTAIAESNLALHSAKMAAPAAGFVNRFQARLAEQRKATRIRQIIGAVILVVGGLGLITWLIAPFIQQVMQSPVEWITTTVGYFLFVLTSIQTFGEASTIILRVIESFISPLGWLVLISIVSGLGFLWTVSITRLTRLPQGV
jgi:hypothetical protein